MVSLEARRSAAEPRHWSCFGGKSVVLKYWSVIEN